MINELQSKRLQDGEIGQQLLTSTKSDDDKTPEFVGCDITDNNNKYVDGPIESFMRIITIKLDYEPSNDIYVLRLNKLSYGLRKSNVCSPDTDKKFGF